MNRGYNLLAFPRGGYLIREKREGRTAGEDNGPSEALDVGAVGVGGVGEEVESHNEPKEMMKMTLSVFNENEDEPSVGLVCKHAAFVAC